MTPFIAGAVLSGSATVVVWVIVALVAAIAVYYAVAAARTGGPWAFVPLLFAVLVFLLVLYLTVGL